jgi:hypothetical protein
MILGKYHDFFGLFKDQALSSAPARPLNPPLLMTPHNTRSGGVQGGRRQTTVYSSYTHEHYDCSK